MANTKYNAILKMMLLIKEDVIGLENLKSYIRMHIAATEKIVSETVHMMVNFGFIKEIEHLKFKVIRDGSL